MAQNLPMVAFIDETEIDELWTALKRDGVPTERVHKAEKKVSARAKFGLGKLLNLLAADLETGLEAGITSETSVKTTITASLRLLLLRELLPDIKALSLETTSEISDLSPNELVDVACPKMSFAQVPRLGSWFFCSALSNFEVGDGDTAPSITERLSYLEKATSSDRALSFTLLSGGFGDGDPLDPAFGALAKHHEEEMLGMLQLSNDNWVVGLSIIGETFPPSHTMLRCLFDEVKLKTQVIASIATQPVRVLGRVAENRELDEYRLLTIVPIALTVSGSNADSGQ